MDIGLDFYLDFDLLVPNTHSHATRLFHPLCAHQALLSPTPSPSYQYLPPITHKLSVNNSMSRSMSTTCDHCSPMRSVACRPFYFFIVKFCFFILLIILFFIALIINKVCLLFSSLSTIRESYCLVLFSLVLYCFIVRFDLPYIYIYISFCSLYLILL